MDHTYIAEQDVANRYLIGSLPPDERAQFEEHFVDCAQCLDTLEQLDQFGAALKTIAAGQPLTRVGALHDRQSVRKSRPLQVAALAAGVLIAIGTVDLIRTHQALGKATLVSDDLTRQSAAADERVRALSNEVAALKRTVESGPTAGSTSPASAPVFALVQTRTGDTAAPPNRISLPASSQWIVLLVDVPAKADRFRGTLRGGDRTVWSDDHLVASASGSLAVGLSSAQLAPGDYTLTVEPRAGSAWGSGSNFRFRVVSR
ncbi:MAG TPA: hypothetical protein VH583_25430 [Vicinamibacterales bacterium]|jgi:hypothetical protein